MAVSWTTRGDATVIFHRWVADFHILNRSTRLANGARAQLLRRGAGGERVRRAGWCRGFQTSLGRTHGGAVGNSERLFGIRLAQETYNSRLLTAHRICRTTTNRGRTQGLPNRFQRETSRHETPSSLLVCASEDAERVADPQASSSRRSTERGLPSTWVEPSSFRGGDCSRARVT